MAQAIPLQRNKPGLVDLLTWVAQCSARTHYLFAIAVTLLAATAQALLAAFNLPSLPNAPYFPAILVAAATGGVGPAMLSTVLGIVADITNAHLFADVPPPVPVLAAGVIIQLLVGISFSWLGSRIKAQFLPGSAQVAPVINAATAEAEHEATITVDAHGVVRSFNAAAELLFGWPAGDVVDKHFSMLQPTQQSSEAEQHLLHFLETPGGSGMSRWYSSSCVRQDGRVFPVNVQIRESRPDGVRKFAFVVEGRRGVNDTDDRLIQLQSRISQIARIAAVSEMAATLAHQLNQPLAAVTNYVRAAQRMLKAMPAPASEETKTALEKAAEQALRAGQVIRHAREFVRLDESEKKIEDAAELLEEAVSVALLWPHEGSITVSLRLDRDDSKVRVNRLLIQQVVVSLIRNALRELADSPRRELIVSAQRDDSRTLRVQIADSGPGIASDALQQVFEPFVTGQSDRIGMGLSVSRSIIEAHGGAISVAPNPGGGSIFTFTLPLERQVDMPAAA